MQGNALTKANPIQFYWIESHADFTPCMDAVGSIGYSGSLTSTVTENGVVWQLVLNGPNQGGVIVGIGEVISWDGKQLTHWENADAFLALNTIA